MSDPKLDALLREAQSAAKGLRGPQLSVLIKYLGALADETARLGMQTKDVATLRQRQGEHRAICKIAALLMGTGGEKTRTKVRLN